MDIEIADFVWDPKKELSNINKHGFDFATAAKVFKNPGRKIIIDSKHSAKEKRSFCLGKIENRVLTVRFSYRRGKIRIIGAGYWRKGNEYYEKKYKR